jgi:endonuclease/exonuclease/phosphatase family metal-dependent hydrolase
MKIKAMQYNIRTGFRKTEKPYEYEGERLKLAKEIIKKENPDILILNEAYFESENESGILMDYQKIFNFPFYAHGNYKKGLSPFWGHAILSKFPIEESINKSEGLAGLFSAKIKIQSKFLNLDVVHISPIPYLSSKKQESFIKKVLKNKKKNYLLSGDFNSLSPLDEYDEIEMIGAWSKFEKNAEKTIKEMLKRDAVKFVLSKGLIDTHRTKNKVIDFSIPTDFLSKDKSSGIRIDYIFCSEEFKVLNSGIIKNRFTEEASDHYPIFAELEI